MRLFRFYPIAVRTNNDDCTNEAKKNRLAWETHHERRTQIDLNIK